MLPRFTLIFLLILLLGKAGPLAAQTVPAWSPAPAETPYLAAEVVLQHCALRPPIGFTLLKETSFRSGRKEDKFIGLRRPDGSAPTLLITTEIGQTAGPDWTVAQGMHDLLHSLDDTLTLDKVTDTQQGTVSGLPALRAYGKGNSLVNTHIDGPGIMHHRLAHVIVYGVGDNRMAVIALASDLEPHTGVYDPQILLQMEAAMQTLRLTDPPPSDPSPPPALFPGQWLPRADLLPFLGPETVVGGIAIRIPRGYDLGTLQMGDTGKDAPLFGFVWQQHGSKTPAMLRVIVQPVPPGQTPRPLSELMPKVVVAEGLNQKDYVHTDIEYGTTGFGSAGRFTGAGNIPVIGNSVVIPRTCTVYGIVTPTQFIRFEALTNDLDSAGTMQVLAASILTGHFAAPTR